VITFCSYLQNIDNSYLLSVTAQVSGMHSFKNCSFYLQGVLRSRGHKILFADADGATRFADIDKLEAELTKLMAKSQARQVMDQIQFNLQNNWKCNLYAFIKNSTIFMYVVQFCVPFSIQYQFDINVHTFPLVCVVTFDINSRTFPLVCVGTFDVDITS